MFLPESIALISNGYVRGRAEPQGNYKNFVSPTSGLN